LKAYTASPQHAEMLYIGYSLLYVYTRLVVRPTSRRQVAVVEFRPDSVQLASERTTRHAALSRGVAETRINERHRQAETERQRTRLYYTIHREP